MRRDAQWIRQQLGELVQRCHAAGLSVTPQRQAIFEALVSATDHPTPEVLYQRVRERLPKLSLATVYKVLATLRDLGLVSEVSAIAEAQRYEANGQRHHHLICQSCRSISDLYDDGFDHIVPTGDLSGFVPRLISVQVVGLCAACAQAAPPG